MPASKTTALDDIDLECLDFIYAQPGVCRHVLARNTAPWGISEARRFGGHIPRKASVYRLEVAGLVETSGGTWSPTTAGYELGSFRFRAAWSAQNA